MGQKCLSLVNWDQVIWLEGWVTLHSIHSIWKCIVLEITEQSIHIHSAWGFRKHIIQFQIVSVKTGSTVCIRKSPPEVYKSLKLVHGTFLEHSAGQAWCQVLRIHTVLLGTCSLPSRCSWCRRQHLSDCSNAISICVCWDPNYVGKTAKEGSPSQLFCPLVQFLYF